MPRIRTRDRVKLHYKDWGAGRPLVLLHGWPLQADSWDAVAMPLAEQGHRCIAYDRRGFGRSEQPFSGYDYDTLSDDLADVIAELGLQEVILVGFSMGGGEVARYMSRHGGKSVVGAVLVSSVVPFMLKTSDNPHGTPQQVFDEMAHGLKSDRPHFYGSFFEDFYGVKILSQPVSKEWLEWSRHMSMQASLKATLECAKAFASTDFRPDLPHFRVPTLVIHGTADKTVPIDAAGRAAAAGIADARLVEYEDAPHGLFATHTERLIGDLSAFLHQLEAVPASRRSARS